MPSASPSPQLTPPRLRAGGKYLRVDREKWFLNGVTYGPFKPNTDGEPFPEPERLAADFALIRSLGFNTVRLYNPPSEALLNAALANDLRLIIGIPWTDHQDFLACRDRREKIENAVRHAAQRYGAHPAVAALLVGNEIEKTLVRWMGPVKVKRFLEKLIGIAHAEAPHCLVSYATYPSTEYLVPVNADFLAVNVYLEEEAAFEKYLRRLQNLAGNKPLIITEFGVDVLRNGEDSQAAIRTWQMACVERRGVAGNVWFSFTDEWFRGGAEVTNWAFGLVTADRKPRSAAGVSRCITSPGPPTVSVVVCTYNGGATLRGCLEALEHQSLPPLEVIVVDDGSNDDSPEIAQAFPAVRYVRQEHAGLSVARNLGARMAKGEIIAYTDDDCMADEDWLKHLAPAFDDPLWVAAGGPNIPPAPRTATEAVVAVSPGGPSHVLLNDEEAEHLPGCNLAIRKSALDRIGGFKAPYVAAGDDVDICWRLREAGGRLRFVPGAMVWHHRRFSVRSYFRQQSGYGRAEALLMRDHPERFGTLGGARWRGLIYGDNNGASPPAEGLIFHGPFGTGLFQLVYASPVCCWFDLFAGLPWLLAALVLALFHGLPVSLFLVAVALYAAWRRGESREVSGWRARLLLWFLCLAQPVVRDWARIKGMVVLGARPAFKPFLPYVVPPRRPAKNTRKALELVFWSDAGVGREVWIQEFRNVLAEDRLTAREDDGWRWFDFELFDLVGLASVTEYHGGLKMLTRVAINRRSPRSWAQAVRWLVPAACLAFIQHDLASRVTAAAVVAVCFAGFDRLLFWPSAKSKARQLVLRAARRAGLQQIEDGSLSSKDYAVPASASAMATSRSLPS